MQKYVNLVDVVKSFPTSIYLQNRRRYSRERAPRSLGENSIHYSFASLVRPHGSGGGDSGAVRSLGRDSLYDVQQGLFNPSVRKKLFHGWPDKAADQRYLEPKGHCGFRECFLSFLRSISRVSSGAAPEFLSPSRIMVVASFGSLAARCQLPSSRSFRRTSCLSFATREDLSGRAFQTLTFVHVS